MGGKDSQEEGSIAAVMAEEISNGVKPDLSNGTTKDAQSAKEEGKDATVEPGKKCELKALEERYNKDGALEVSEIGAYRKGSKERFEDYAMVTKQRYNKDSTLRTATLQVNSPYILRILEEVVRVYATQPAGFSVPIVEEAPFALFFHYRDRLSAYETDDDNIKQHHSLLMQWISIELDQVCKEVDNLTKKGYITFSLLWTIFIPGELQYASMHGNSRLFKLETVAYKEIAMKGPVFEVNSRYVDYNGTHVGHAKERHFLFDKQIFTGKSPTRIATLPIFPRRFVDDDDLEERLRDRGERMLELKGIVNMQYDGLLEYLLMPPFSWWGPSCERDGQWIPISICGRVMVDKKTFSEDFAQETSSVEAASEPPNPNAQNAYLLSSATYSLEEDTIDPMLCPPYTIGYSLDRKVWCRLFIDHLRSIKWRPNPMDELILPPTQKKVLEALVGSHIFPEQARDEWNSKGKGLVILLHGTPGSGKTLTAETAAEHTKRALLKISLGELRDEDRLEHNMLQFQRYAATWQAIVLIDEADVFLEARTSAGSKDSADRNALVAVFLRTLEYFQGIIFLTSNRVSVFDQAIKSRVHLALQYSAPNQASRRQLWHNGFMALPAGSTEFVTGQNGGDRLKGVLDRVEGAEMNGREISNSIHTALTLARDNRMKLKEQHLETIIEVWGEFARHFDGITEAK